MNTYYRLSLYFILNFLLITEFPDSAYSQVTNNTNGSTINAVPTAVPFITITPDARSGAMGEAGVATSPDASAAYWNAAKLTFLEKSTISLSYSPWLRRILPKANLAYLSYGGKIDERNALGLSLRYFNAGTSELYDENIVAQGFYQPAEFAIDGSLARKFGNNFSLSLTARYIYSKLGTSSGAQLGQMKPGHAVATDVGAYYRSQTQVFGKDALFSLGMNISNMGTKMSYALDQKFFLPANLRIGFANTWYVDSYSQVTIAMDFNKLLVPTPPLRDAQGNIVAGKEDDRSVVAGIFGSFNDAPGGINEELKEINVGTGIEYWYDKQVAFRLGYFYESPDKGNRRYLTIGTGFNYKNLQFDFSYLIADQQKSPLANTLRFSVGYAFQ